MISLDLTTIPLKLRNTGAATQVWEPLRRKWVHLSPEEHVRQCLIGYLSSEMHYPAGRMASEKQIQVGPRLKRFDLVVYDGAHKPWLMAECKAPDVPITNAALHQLLAYQRSTACRYWLLTNGHQHFCADAANPENIIWLSELPLYEL